MKSISSLCSLCSSTQKVQQTQQQWALEMRQEIQKMKKPFINRVQLSKMRIQKKIQDSKLKYQTFAQDEQTVERLIQNSLNHNIVNQKKQRQVTEQSEKIQNKKQIKRQIQKNNTFSLKKDKNIDEIHKSQISQPKVEWQGREKEITFKNSSAMIEQFETIFDKKLPSNLFKNKQSYSYRKDERQMLQNIFAQLKLPTENTVSFHKVYQFFNQCKLFYTVYGINPKELEDLVMSSAHKYPDKITKEQFFDLFLINPQARKFQELQSKVQKICCLSEQNWSELRQLFSQLDTFGCGTVRTQEFFHKLKTISTSKQLLQANTIYFPNINRFYSFKKVIFELQNKMKLPEKLNWSELQKCIREFSHMDYPSIDQIFQKQIKTACIKNNTNNFLLKSDTIEILKKQFRRFPKFCDHFVRLKYFCEELLQTQAIDKCQNEPVRKNNSGKGFVNLLKNIKLLQSNGPEYLDMDEMLNYFSIRGFQQQQESRLLKQNLETKSTASDEQFQDRKRQQRRVERMRSLDQMNKIMTKGKSGQFISQNKKSTFKPVKVQEFNITKPRDYLTIRQQKVKDMIEEKRKKEQAEIKPFIIANPIPPTLNSQRYQDQKNKQELQRQLQRQRNNKKYEKYEKQLQYLRSTTKLFQKRTIQTPQKQKQIIPSPSIKKAFETKPIQWFVKERNLLQIIEAQKQQRRKNRLKQTRQKYEYGYWKNLPYQADSNFRQNTITQNLKQKSDQQSLDLKIKKSEQNNLSQKQQNYKTTIVPDFAKLQREFMQELESKKKLISPTVVKEFNLSLSKKKLPQISQANQSKRVYSAQKQKDNSNKNQNIPFMVGTTKKYESMVQLTQFKIAQKNYEALMKQKQQKQRRKKQKAFAKFMRKVLKQEISAKKSQKSQKTTRRNDSSARTQHEKQLRKIYEKVLSRPFLFQTDFSQSKGLSKKSRNSKKSKKSIPTKVNIPNQELRLQIPPLKYIETEQYPAIYQNEGELCSDQQNKAYMINEFNTSNQQEEESYIQNIHPQENSFSYDNSVQNLNQSF